MSDTAYAPLSLKIQIKLIKGIDVDIINKVAEIKGWNIQMSYPGFDAAVNAVQAGQADAIMAGMTKTKRTWKVFTMSDTYYDTKVVIATTKAHKISKYDQLTGKTVGVKNGTAAQRFLETIKDKYGFTIKTFDTSDLMNNSLSAGAIDAMMDDKPVIEYAINQGQDLHIEMDGEAVGVCFRCEKGSKYEHLVTEFNQALAEMKKMVVLIKSSKEMDCFVFFVRYQLQLLQLVWKQLLLKLNTSLPAILLFAPFVFQNQATNLLVLIWLD